MRVTGYPRPSRRTGFTLIELLVVIAIISVLVGLLAAGVMKAMNAGPRAQTASDIREFETGLTTCRSELGNVDYLPSRLVLREDGNYTPTTNTDHAATVKILSKMFGKHVCDTGRQIDWNGDGAINTTPGAAGEYLLQGPQCLIFYLGGIPSTSGPQGFSKDPLNPAKVGGQRYGPYFTNFKADRLGKDTNGFYYYLDPYRKAPYIYFSSNGAGNDYNNVTGARADFPATLGTLTLQPSSVLPYQMGQRRTGTPPNVTTIIDYVNPKGCQIIAAGADGIFGVGGSAAGTAAPWAPDLGYKGLAPGADDMANFSKSPLAGAAN